MYEEDVGFSEAKRTLGINEIEQMSESTNRDAGEATTDVLQAEQVDTFQPHVWYPSLSPHTTMFKEKLSVNYPFDHIRCLS